MAGLPKEGLLNKIDLAFSRDQKEKVYVQDKMLANASELYAWLESGAYFYVCGDASRMAQMWIKPCTKLSKSKQAFQKMQQLNTSKR